MSVMRVERNPSRSQLAVFGFLWLAFFTGLGAVLLAQGKTWMSVAMLWLLAAAVPSIGWAVPGFTRIVYVGTAYATFPVGWVLSLLVVAIIYYLILSPVGLLLRLLRHDSMCRAFEPSAQSYWEIRETGNSTDRYFRQF